MPSPLSTAFVKAARSYQPRMVTLVKVELTFPSTRTIYLSSDQVTTPDGRTWEPHLTTPGEGGSIGVVHAQGRTLATVGTDVTFQFYFKANAKFGFQAAGKKAATALVDFRWMGATVTAYAWERGLASFPEGQQFKGIISDVESSFDRVRVQCVQRRDWNRTVPRTVRRSEFPRAAQQSIGAILPVAYGYVRSPKFRSSSKGNWTALSSSRAIIEQITGGMIGIPGVVVDSGIDDATAKRKVLFTGHECGIVNNSTFGTKYYYVRDGKLHHFDPDAGDVINAASGAGLTIPDDFDRVHYGIMPTDIDKRIANTEPAQDPRYAMDGWEELTHALLDYDATKRLQRWALPSISPPGSLYGTDPVKLVLGYISSSTLTNFKIAFDRRDVGGSEFAVAAASSQPIAGEYTITADAWGTAPLPIQPWAFDECYLQVRWSAAAAGQWVRVFFIGLTVRYRAEEFSSFTTFTRYVYINPGSVPYPGVELEPPIAVGPPTRARQEIIGSRIAASVGGHKDDGSGTYSGGAGSVMERFPDIARHLLSVYGGQTAGQFMLETNGNLITNPSFELDTSGWSKASGLVMAKRNSLATPPHGKWSVALIFDGTASNAWRYNLTGLTNNTYTLSFWYKTSDSIGSTLLAVVWDLAIGGQSSASKTILTTGGVWKRESLTFTITGVHASGTGYVDCPRGATGVSFTMEVDAVQLEQLSEARSFGVLGSFIDARDVLRDIRRNRLTAGLVITENATVKDVLQWLAEASTSWVFLSRFDDKWRFVPWRRGLGTRYDRKLYKDDLLEAPTVQHLPVNDLLSATRVPYGWDPQTNGYRYEVGVGIGHSNAGQQYSSVRDQYLTVVTGENDKINFKSGVTNYTATLAAGDYTDETMIEEVRSKVNAQLATVSVGWGCRIKAGSNDKVRWNSGLAKTYTFPARLFGDMEEMAADLERGMRVEDPSSNWTVTYNRTTRKFTLAAGSGTPTLTLGGTDSAAATLGFSNDSHGAAASFTSDAEVDEEKFIITASYSFILQWENGANALTSAADLLGFDARHDTADAKWQPAQASKWYHERTYADAVARYGHKRELVIDGRATYETDTALDARRRVTDYLTSERLVLRFRTTRCPDLERGRIVELDADVGDLAVYPKQGSDGSWAGKNFMVLEVLQYMGPSYHQEVVAMEND